MPPGSCPSGYPPKFFAELNAHLGQPGGQYHVPRLTKSKTRGCNFIGVILAAAGRATSVLRGLREGGCAMTEVIIPLTQVTVRPDDTDDLGWQDRALCAQTDPEAFFPEKGGSTREAKRVSRSCDVRGECLEYALENDERFGIWGGLSERERRRIKREVV